MGSIPATGDSHGIALIVVSAIFTALATVAALLRLWARRIKKTSLSVNDYAVLVALVFAYALFAGFIVAVVSGGAGQHQSKILQDPVTGFETLIRLNKCFLALEIIWVCANAAVKISILHLYIQIFRGRMFCIATYCLMGLTFIYAIIVFLEAVLLCRPLARFWDARINGTCADEISAYMSVGVINLLIDVMIIVLPMPMLWGLQMKTSKKVGLTGIFGIGAVICVISILRIVSIQRLNPLDLTYSVVEDGFWSMLEPNLGIINACLPVIQPVIQKLTGFPIFAWTRGTNKESQLWLRSNETGKRSTTSANHFQRLDEHTYPLTNANPTRNQITGPENKTKFGFCDPEGQEVNYEVEPARMHISVKKDWDVESRDRASA